jgi:C4-type Zn-finger protein
MFVRILCQKCGFEVSDTVECRLLMAHREDWVQFMIRRAAAGGKTARFLKARAIPCPQCSSESDWISRAHDDPGLREVSAREA